MDWYPSYSTFNTRLHVKTQVQYCTWNIKFQPRLKTNQFHNNKILLCWWGGFFLYRYRKWTDVLKCATLERFTTKKAEKKKRYNNTIIKVISSYEVSLSNTSIQTICSFHRRQVQYGEGGGGNGWYHSCYTSRCTDTIDKAFSALVKNKKTTKEDSGVMGGRYCIKLNIRCSYYHVCIGRRISVCMCLEKVTFTQEYITITKLKLFCRHVLIWSVCVCVYLFFLVCIHLGNTLLKGGTIYYCITLTLLAVTKLCPRNSQS